MADTHIGTSLSEELLGEFSQTVHSYSKQFFLMSFDIVPYVFD